MTGREAEAAGRRIAIHLRKGQFAACHNIIKELKQSCRDRKKDVPTAIAELPIDLRWVNMLEEAGYIYIDDLDGVDLDQLDIKYLSEVGKDQIGRAVTIERERRKRREKRKRLRQEAGGI